MKRAVAWLLMLPLLLSTASGMDGSGRVSAELQRLVTSGHAGAGADAITPGQRTLVTTAYPSAAGAAASPLALIQHASRDVRTPHGNGPARLVPDAPSIHPGDHGVLEQDGPRITAPQRLVHPSGTWPNPPPSARSS